MINIKIDAKFYKNFEIFYKLKPKKNIDPQAAIRYDLSQYILKESASDLTLLFSSILK